MTEALKLLIAERDRIDKAIAVSQGESSRPSPPPGPAEKKAVKKRRRRRRSNMSEEQRKAVSERMKNHWAAWRKAKKKA